MYSQTQQLRNLFINEQYLSLTLGGAVTVVSQPGSGGGGTRVGFGWVCAAQTSKCRPHFRKGL